MRLKLALAFVVIGGAAVAQPLTPGYRRPTMPPPHMGCIVPPAPGFAGMTCRTPSGVRGALCRCGDLPYPGHKDFVRF